MKKSIILLILSILLSPCAKSSYIIDGYIPYEKIPDNYSLENAKADGLVVYENLDITSGQEIWDRFLENTQNGIPDMVRLAFHYTLGDPSHYSPEYYEEIKNDYPRLHISDLSFDGEIYTIFYMVEDGHEYTREYKYLKRFEEDLPRNNEISKRVQYVLVNDNEVTWEQVLRGMLSSQFGASIDHTTVYYKYIYEEVE